MATTPIRVLRIIWAALFVSWALFQSCAIYGLILALVKFDWRMVIGPEVLTAIGFITTYPQADVA